MKVHPPVLEAGAELGSYVIGQELGRGGMGVVYEATDLRSGRVVALKVVAPAQASARERFLREARLAAAVHHPNIVTVRDSGEAEGLLYLAMDKVGGRDLGAVLAERGPLSPREALGVIAQVAGGLQAAHSAGLVHRDVKPQNILCDPSGNALLSDFGITRDMSDTAATLTGELIGSLHYVAPEQIDGGDLDERADVYSLGCVLYECLTGEVPFPREHDAAVLWAHMKADRPVPSTRRSGLPAGCDEVVLRALAIAPEARYGSVESLQADLLEIAAGRTPAGAGASTKDLRSPASQGQSSLDPYARPTTIAALRRGVTAFSTAAAIVLLLGSGAIALRVASDRGAVAGRSGSADREAPQGSSLGEVTDPRDPAGRPTRAESPEDPDLFSLVSGGTLTRSRRPEPIEGLPSEVTLPRIGRPAPERGAVLPSPGRYVYSQEGEQELCGADGAGDLCASSSALPSSISFQVSDALWNDEPATVVAARDRTGEAKTVLTVSGSVKERLFKEHRSHQGLEFLIDVQPPGGILVWKPGARPGTTWETAWEGETFGDHVAQFVRYERIGVGRGRRVRAARVLSTTRFFGRSEGTLIQTRWIDPRTNLMVRSNGQLIFEDRGTQGIGELRVRFARSLQRGPGYR